MKWLQGKKTILGSLLLSLIGVVWSLDQFTPDVAWFSDTQYIAAGTFIAGLTGAAMRLGIKAGR